MRIKMQIATAEDVADIVALRSAAAARLTEKFGRGDWSGVSTEKGVLFDLRTSKVYVVRRRSKLVASLRLTAKKPWAIDTSYFSECKQPLYLLSMAVAPDWQQKGIGRLCVTEAAKIARQWPAGALRLDAYNSPAGAGPFYRKCGFQQVGRVSYRGCPLEYFEMML